MSSAQVPTAPVPVAPSGSPRDDRRLQVVLALGILLPIAGWIAGATDVDRIAAPDHWSDAWISGLIARTFAVPFAASIVINALLWWRRPAASSGSARPVLIALAVVDLAGLAWVGGLFLPDLAQDLSGIIAGPIVAIGSIVVCVMLVRLRRARRITLSPADLAPHDAARAHHRRRTLVVAGGVVVVAAAAVAVVATVPVGHYENCSIMGESYDDNGHIQINTANCGDFALRGNSVTYNSIDADGTYAFSTRGFSFLPWGKKVVTFTRLG